MLRLSRAAALLALSTAGCVADPPPSELFPKSDVAPAAGGLRRLTSTQIRNTLSDWLGATAAATLKLPDDHQLHGFQSIEARDDAFTPAAISSFESTFTFAIETAQKGDISATPLGALVPCVAAPDEACFTTVAQTFGRVAWRRPLEADEVATLVDLGKQGATATGSASGGLKYELLTIFQSPNFLYIVEIGDPDADSISGGVPDSGQRKLNAYELATRMSFFLLDRAPDVVALDKAANGGLTTDKQILEEANRLLAKPEAQAAFDRYASEVYSIADLSDVTKDPAAYPMFGPKLATSMQESMTRFLDDIVWTRDADAREIFTSNRYFIDQTLAPLYGFKPPQDEWARVELPADQDRIGLIGNAGFLARFAHPLLTSPTRRGRFIQERLLCEEIPPPPPGQNTSIPSEPAGEEETMKQRLVAHESNPKCATCHSRMDPLGLALEHFDSIGAYRKDDRGLAIDTTGSVADLAPFKNASDIGHALAKSDEALACMVKNLVRESMGHMETTGEDTAIDDLTAQFAWDHYSLKSLMARICVSPAFRLVGDPK